MDYAKINEAAMGYKDDMTKFLRDLVRIPGESCGEKGLSSITILRTVSALRRAFHIGTLSLSHK